MKKFLLATTIFLLAAACNKQAQVQNEQNQQRQTQQSASQNMFEDDRIKVAIPAGWSVKTATQTVTGDQTFELPIGAVFTKGKYELYLLTHYGQASGVVGGRFGEVSHYVAPWTDALFQPNGCDQYTQNSKVSVDGKLDRIDLYFNSMAASKDAFDNCGKPSKSANYWYGSYFSKVCPASPQPGDCGGYFLTYEYLSGKAPQDRVINGMTFNAAGDSQMTYALTFSAKAPDNLPLKGDADLSQVMQEANAIVKSVQYK